jgi:hypothetical protein
MHAPLSTLGIAVHEISNCFEILPVYRFCQQSGWVGHILSGGDFVALKVPCLRPEVQLFFNPFNPNLKENGQRRHRVPHRDPTRRFNVSQTIISSNLTSSA